MPTKNADNAAKRLEELKALEARRRPMRRFLLAACVGVVAGLIAASFLQRLLVNDSVPGTSDSPRVTSLASGDAPGARPEIGTAMAYAQAVQSNDVEHILGAVDWVRERLAYLDMVYGDTAAREEARQRLHKQLVDRSPEHNTLAAEGVEDAYIFQPGATIEVMGIDEGLDDLETPVSGRVWLRVEYASPAMALRDAEGAPLRSLYVGVNVGRDGSIVKANVVGNLQIDYDSISAAW